MSHLYIGCRVEDVESIFPNNNDSKYPTTVRFRSGRSVSVSTSYEATCAAVESRLAMIEESRKPQPHSLADFEERKWQLLSLIAELNREKEDLEASVASCLAASGKPMSALVVLVEKYIESKKQAPGIAWKNAALEIIGKIKELENE